MFVNFSLGFFVELSKSAARLERLLRIEMIKHFVLVPSKARREPGGLDDGFDRVAARLPRTVVCASHTCPNRSPTTEQRLVMKDAIIRSIPLPTMLPRLQLAVFAARCLFQIHGTRLITLEVRCRGYE